MDREAPSGPACSSRRCGPRVSPAVNPGYSSKLIRPQPPLTIAGGSLCQAQPACAASLTAACL